jgi:hypothetical protein
MVGDKNLHLHTVFNGIYIGEEVYKRISQMGIISTMPVEEITDHDWEEGKCDVIKANNGGSDRS